MALACNPRDEQAEARVLGQPGYIVTPFHNESGRDEEQRESDLAEI